MTHNDEQEQRPVGDERDTFAIVPLWLIESASADAVRVFAMLGAKYASRAGECFPSQPTLAADLGVSERAVRRWLAELKDLGAVSWLEGRPGRSNVYRLWTRSVAPRPLSVAEPRTPQSGVGVEPRTPQSGTPDSTVRAARTPQSGELKDPITNRATTTGRDASAPPPSPRTEWNPADDGVPFVEATENGRAALAEARRILLEGSSKLRHPASQEKGGNE